MTMAEETATHVVRLEERMKTQHAKGVTHIADQARHHTSQIAGVHELLANMSDKIEQLKTEYAKRDTRLILISVGTILAVGALIVAILGVLISMQQ